jgi:hypothetical protein
VPTRRLAGLLSYALRRRDPRPHLLDERPERGLHPREFVGSVLRDGLAGRLSLLEVDEVTSGVLGRPVAEDDGDCGQLVPSSELEMEPG